MKVAEQDPESVDDLESTLKLMRHGLVAEPWAASRMSERMALYAVMNMATSLRASKAL